MSRRKSTDVPSETTVSSVEEIRSETFSETIEAGDVGSAAEIFGLDDPGKQPFVSPGVSPPPEPDAALEAAIAARREHARRELELEGSIPRVFRSGGEPPGPREEGDCWESPDGTPRKVWRSGRWKSP